MWYLLLTSSILFSTAIVTAYVIVLGNVGNYFPVPQYNTYFDSPYWLGMKRNNAITVTVFQLFAAAGYTIWFVYLLYDPPTTGLFKSPVWRVVGISTFLVPSAAWPYSAYALVLNPSSVPLAILSSSLLWIASFGVILMIAATFENDNSHPLALAGILLLGTVVILADGIGWSAIAIYSAIHGD